MKLKNRPKKGMSSTLALMMAIVVGLLVVVILVAILSSNTNGLETFAQNHGDATFVPWSDQ